MSLPNNNYCVYKHTTPGGKVYIGITKQAVGKRWKNGAGYELCTAFNRAIVKYGWDNITHEILETGLDKATACKMEQDYIALFDSTNPEHGYNLTNGGEHYEMPEYLRKETAERIRRNYAEHPEIGAKISAIQKGRKASANTRAKMSEARKRYIEAHPETREACGALFRGKTRPPEFAERLREANYKRVQCIETGRVFRSIKDAAAAVGVPRTSISNVLTGRAKTAAGFHFEYYKEASTNAEQ